ncbi:5687_t:CDS:1 [Ambispora leptoticha]|uniref:5687_t:CDS:1 n=1 Tax=Ambispora leptoticha TaxID=144679 RepID=A0A9N8VUR0_9GLOM|nr:5687_t:CDS:1 [Ambispora leptoticha]
MSFIVSQADDESNIDIDIDISNFEKQATLNSTSLLRIKPDNSNIESHYSSTSINQNTDITINSHILQTTTPSQTNDCGSSSDKNVEDNKFLAYKSKIPTGRNVVDDSENRLSDASEDSDTLNRDGALTPPGFWLIDVNSPPRTPEQTAHLAAKEAEGRRRTNEEWKNTQKKKRISPKGSRIYGSHMTK